MNFSERSAQRKKARDLRGEIKLLKKQMIANGCEKSSVNNLLSAFEETLLAAGGLAADYAVSAKHIGQARETILRLLDCMGESPIEEVRESLKALVEHLDFVYHDCSIRQDDLDFQSTITCLRGLVPSYGNGENGMGDIMLRSELENIKAVLDDAAAFRAPDFFALAYYGVHEDKDTLKEMENEQRNEFLLSYLKDHFMDGFQAEIVRGGVSAKVQELMKNYIEQ